MNINDFYYLALSEPANTSKFGIISQRITTMTGSTRTYSL